MIDWYRAIFPKFKLSGQADPGPLIETSQYMLADTDRT
jgi:hypothetical protein